MTKTEKASLTPKRAAAFLAIQALVHGKRMPPFLKKEEMAEELSQFEYTVTELRRKQIIEQFNKLTATFEKKVTAIVETI